MILADSGRMYSFMNQRYLALELYEGVKYDESANEQYEDKLYGGQFVRNRFSKSTIRFDLSSFDMGETDKNAFRNSRLVQTRADLAQGVDSMEVGLLNNRRIMFREMGGYFNYHLLKGVNLPNEMTSELEYYDSIKAVKRAQANLQKEQVSPSATFGQNRGEALDDEVVEEIDVRLTEEARKEKEETEKENKGPKLTYKEIREKIDLFYSAKTKKMNAMTSALNSARASNNSFNASKSTLELLERDQNKFRVTRAQQVSRSFACLIMFLIGAPIGAIIKKGGLGLPVIVSVIFFLIFYTLNTMGDKWGKQGVVDPFLAMWMSNIVLLPFGLFFLRQASKDARLFESDFYAVWLDKLKRYFTNKKQLKTS